MRNKIRTYKIFSILSVCAYLMFGITFFSQIFLPERLLSNEKMFTTLCGVFFFAGMILQGMQLLCDESKDFRFYCIAEPTLKKEEAEELKKWFYEYAKEIDSTPANCEYKWKMNKKR